MDDLMHSCPTTEKAVQSITELDRVLATGSFKIKEWISSSQNVLNQLSRAALRKPDEEKPDESPVVPTAVNLDGEKGVKTLGVGWNPQTGVSRFDVKETNIAKLTKKGCPIQYFKVVKQSFPEGYTWERIMNFEDGAVCTVSNDSRYIAENLI